MDDEDYVQLFDAITIGDLAEVESFLQTPGVDVDINIEEEYGEEDAYTPLIRAIGCNQKSIVEVLLAHGAAVNGVDSAESTPLQVACWQDNANKEIVKLLLEHGAEIDAFMGRFEMTPLTLACNAKANVGIVQLLLNAGADANGGNGEIAPLHEAAKFKNIKALKLLIKAGADVNIQATVDYYLPAESTPLHFAARTGNIVSVATLLAAGADPNITNEDGETPLHSTELRPSADIVNALLAAGCDPLHRDNDGRTPLQLFFNQRRNRNFSASHFKIITALVAAGDRSWGCVPTPCPGLEAAMLSVWQDAPEELPELVKRLKDPPQNLIELYARIHNKEMKKVVQEVLRVLHHHFSGFPHLKEHLLYTIFGFTTSL